MITISDVIERLNALKDEYGDLPVFVRNQEGLQCELTHRFDLELDVDFYPKRLRDHFYPNDLPDRILIGE